ncbi:hypothetical protein BDZ89DRAFT_1066173 [Hymenopellis radicata]|nr:hypothetical protein BDZ89DRAFT_1066173 [Hymenopellis radicata]
MTAPPVPQTVFRYYRANDDRSPRRKANAFETDILVSLVTQVNMFFRIPRIVRLVALYLQKSEDEDLDVDAVNVSPEALEAAKNILASVVPQIDLVEGLVQEGRVVKAPDSSPDAPAPTKPIRIDIRAERIYSLCSIAAHMGPEYQNKPVYRRAFSWAFCVLLHQVMHFVCDTPHRQPASTSRESPRLQSHPTTASRLKPRPKGAGFWLEEELYGGTYLAAQDSPAEYPVPRHPTVPVPDGLILYHIRDIRAKTLCENGGYKIWILDDELLPLVGPFTDAASPSAMESISRNLESHISSTDPIMKTAQLAQVSLKYDGEHEASVIRDVFLGDEMDEEVQKYNKWRYTPWKEGELDL